MTIQRVLVIRLGAMGDLVHAASAVQAIKRQYSDVQVDWLTSPAYISLLKAFEFEGAPLLSHVWGYDKKEGLKGFLDVALAIRQKRYDAIINLHTSLKTWLLSHIAIIGREGEYYQYQKEKLSIQGEEQRDIPRFHAAEDFLQPFLALFPQASLDDLRYLFPPAPITPELPHSTGKPQVALIVGVGQKRGNRGWPTEHYQKLIALILAQTDASIVLIGGPEEVESGSQLESAYVDYTLATGRLENRCGKLSLLETAAALRQSNVVIGGDTGPLHLASCFDVPIIGIFGPTSIHRTGALGPEAKRHHLLPHPGLDCWPCELPTCPLPAEQYLACMKETAPESVMAAILNIIPKN